MKSLAFIIKQPIFQTLLLFIGVFAFGTPIYSQIDDVHITRMVSGAYTGSPYEYVHAIHIYLSSFMVFLYRMYPTVNWYALVLYFFLFLSLYAVCAALAPAVRRNNPAGAIALVFAWLVYAYAISQLQYVTVAGLSALSGLLLVLSLWRRGSLPVLLLVVSFFLFLAGFMLREGMAYLAFLLAAPPAWYRYTRSDAHNKKRLILFLVFLISGIFILKCAQTGAYNAYPRIRQDEKWFDTQIAFNNFYLYHFMFHPEIYKAVGWSANDYATYDSWLNQDERIFSQDDVSAVMTQAIRKLPNAPWQMTYVYDALKVNLIRTGGVYLWAAYFFVGMSIVLLKRERRMIFLTALFFIGFVLYFSYLIRIVPYRVSVPVALFLGTFIPISADIPLRFKKGISVIIFYTAVAILLICVGYEFYAETKSNATKIARFNSMLDLMPKKEDALVFLWDSALPVNWMSPFDDYSMMKMYALAGGGWPQRLAPERELFRQHGVTDLYKDFYEKDNVLLVATDEQMGYYRTFMKEHFDIDVKFQILRDFSMFDIEKSRYGYGGKLVKIVRAN